MPWTVSPNDAACPTDRPWSVRLESTGRLEGCHASEDAALAQVAALHAAEQRVRSTVDAAAHSSLGRIVAAVRDIVPSPWPPSPSEFAALDDLDLKPTGGMKDEAQRGLDWRDELERGGTAVGIARARDIVNEARLSPDTVKRMHSFFARHEVDKRAEGFRPGEDGYPSNGRIAWALWGGDPGQTWAAAKVEQIRRIEAENQ